jgi:hypothetical protein
MCPLWQEKFFGCAFVYLRPSAFIRGFRDSVLSFLRIIWLFFVCFVIQGFSFLVAFLALSENPVAFRTASALI